MSGMGDPTSSYATAGIALRVSGAFKPHHHDKVETPSMGTILHHRAINQKATVYEYMWTLTETVLVLKYSYKCALLMKTADS
jgi:hypothetical protein